MIPAPVFEDTPSLTIGRHWLDHLSQPFQLHNLFATKNLQYVFHV